MTINLAQQELPIFRLAYYPDDNLLKPTIPIEDFSQTSIIARLMFDTMVYHGAVGLAANQVKLPWRMFVMRTMTTRKAFLNPRIVQTFGGIIFNEQCLSFPGVEIEKQRAERVIIEAHDELGNQFTADLTGLDAVCAQHELEHLDGITFIDDLGYIRRKFIEAKVRKHVRARTKP